MMTDELALSGLAYAVDIQCGFVLGFCEINGGHFVLRVRVISGCCRSEIFSLLFLQY